MLPVLEHVVVIVSNMDDLNAAPSGHGYEYEQIHTSFCPDGLPLDFALLTLLAAFGVAFGVLYVALTMASGGRRSDSSSSEQSLLALLGSNLADLLWSGKCLANYFKSDFNFSRRFTLFYAIWR